MGNGATRLYGGVYRLMILSTICFGWAEVQYPNTAEAGVSLLGVQYQQDNPYTEFQCIWHDRDYPYSCGSVVTGSNVHVYLKNTGDTPVTVTEVRLAGYPLSTVITESPEYDNDARSIFFHWDDPPADILNAGEPVWYKADPNPIPGNGVAQVVIRLRSVPVTRPVSIAVETTAGTINATVPVNANAPQLASVGFSLDRTQAYLHWRRAGGAAPAHIWMDGVEVTANAITVGDPNVNFAESVLTFGTPLVMNSYHVFQGVYPDGSTATASLRAWAHEFIHASWHSFPIASGDTTAAQAWIDDCTHRGVNAVENQMYGGLSSFLNTPSGEAYAAARGYDYIAWNSSLSYKPVMWFLDDEPDGEEDTMDCGSGLMLPCGSGHDTGVLVMRNLDKGREFRSIHPDLPITVNMDGTLKPDNYYSYGQAVDCLQVDPYYQKRMVDGYIKNNLLIPLYEKATYIYAVSQAVTTAAEPNPSHVILYSCRWVSNDGSNFWPFPTRESKRIEVYYALAGGAKGLSYWWFTLPDGLGAQTPEALALWDEIGLLGNEIKTVSPLLVRSHPVAMPLAPSANVWAKALACGPDTMILLAVNDDYFNDKAGCHYNPVAGASVTASLPAWMQASPTAFEVTAGGLMDVTSQLDAGQFQIDLGTLNLTRMIVITTNPQLRAQVQQRYDQLVLPNICAFAPGLCPGVVPTITEQPLNHTVDPNRSVSFTVAAEGSFPLSYQWQKNNADLADGGHYSGATTATLTISSASSDDVATYRCVVSNAYGSATSNSAALSLSNPLVCLANRDFEEGFTSGVGNSWTKFIKAGSEGTRLSFSDETDQTHNGSHAQEVYSHDVGYDGGVYQRFPAIVGQPYTIRAWIKVYSPQGSGVAEGFLGVDATGGTNPNGATVQWTSKPWEYWSEDARSVLAQGNYITVFLRGRSTKSATSGKTAYVWFDEVQVQPGSPTDSTPTAESPSSIRWRWTDLAIETGYRVRDEAGEDKSGVLAANTVEWTETAGLAPNTQYTRRIHTLGNCGESEGSTGQTAYTLSAAPQADSITPSSPPVVNEPILWTPAIPFGPGTVQYYRFAWDQSETHTWTGAESQWSTGTLSTLPTATGPWYLHVQGYNAADVANGTYDYLVTVVSAIVPADFDRDGDVDLADFDLFVPCASLPTIAPAAGCENRDLDHDNDVDQADFGIFQRCYGGPDLPIAPACVND